MASTRPGSPPPSHSQTPPTTTSRRVDEAKTYALSILNDTDWPKEVAHDVQSLIATMGTLPDLSKIPTDETQIRTEVKVSINLLIKELGSVRTRLEGESKKYGTRKKGFRKGVKKFFSRVDASECSRVLKACWNDVEESSATLNNFLSILDTENEEHSSQAAQGQPGASSNLMGTQTPPAAMPSPITNTAQPNNSPFAPPSTPHISQVASVGPVKQPGSSRRGELLNGARKAFKFAEGVSAALPVVGISVGAVAKVGLTVVEMVQVMAENNETAERLGAHVRRISNVLETFSTQPRQPKSQTANGMEDLQQALRDVQHEIAEQHSQPGLKKFWDSSDQSGSLKKLQDNVRVALEEIQLLVNLKTSILVDELHTESTQNRYHRLLDRLGDGKYGARGEVIEDVTCLPGTRVEILKRIDDWIRGGPSSERVLWIRAMAGRGKSTIASTVAHTWKDRACCAIYHFRRGQNTSNASLVCALARQLARSLDPELRSAILSTVEENDGIINQRLDEQFDALFTASLRTLKAKGFPILVVVDALDECDTVDYAVNFVKIIDRHSPSLPDNLKFLLTSRPEAPLIRTLELRKWRTESLDSLDDADADIELFLSHSLLQVKEEHEIPGEWPALADIPRLAKMSQGLFQWARTVVKYINDGSPTDQLAEVLESPAVWSGVDELYTQILSKALERAKQHSAKENLLLTLLATLVVTPYPVSLEVITFLHIEHDLIKGKSPGTVFNFLRRGILADLNSLLFIPPSSAEPIRLMHTSIRDLLVDRGRCKGQPYWGDLVEHHQRLAAACIRRMNQNLRANICNLTNLSKPSSEFKDIVEREVSKGIQYCCRSWSIHLTKRQQALRPEIMSLVGSSNEAIIMAKEAHQWLLRNPGSASGSDSLVILWNDVHRFTTAFADPIAFGPLHIYASALSHCPEKTELWKRYSSHAKVRTIRGVQPPRWSSDLWTRPVGGNVNSVAFSPDSTLLALGCGDEVIRLLDPHSGRQMRQPLTGHRDFVRSVCFSPDGKLLVSGSDDETIRRWDPQTGGQVGEPLTGHSSAVKSVCFSPDGRLLASGCDDKTVRLWDPQTGRRMGEPLSGHRDRVNSVCFSPNGKLLASGSKDDTIRLWDPQTGRQMSKPLTGHSNTIESVCFSPDGKLLASGSWDNTIRPWNPQTGSQVGEPLIGHNQAVCSVCFSADGKLLASGSRDYSVRLWDPETGGQAGEPFTRHSGVIQTVCFSPDGKHLASGSTDHTARLWDPQTGSQAGEPLIGHNSAIETVCFSPDGKLLASRAWDRTIRLWESQTGNLLGQPLTGHDGIVQSVCFSADGKLLASGSWDMTIRLWDPQTGNQVGEPLTGHSHTVYSVCFSPDGKLLASGSDDKTIRLWDSQTGSQVGEPLTGHTHSIRSVCFSPDGKLLASRSYDNTIRLWNPQTGSHVGQPLTGCDSRFRSLWFSPDSKYVAGQVRDGNALAWDVVSCKPCNSSASISTAATVSYDDHWVTLSSSRLFWLPSQYWSGPRCQVTLCAGKLAVVHDQTLSIFDLSGALSL